MRSIFFLLSACSAVAQASECQAADETTLLQGVRMGDSLVRKGMNATEAKSWDAQGLVKSLQHVANNLDTMSTDEVSQASNHSQASNLLPASGFYRIQHKLDQKYMDAYESDQYYAVTRSWQNNPSQWWYLQGVGALEDQVYTIQQVGKNDWAPNGRYLDAYETHHVGRHRHRATTRTEQDHDSQRWHFTRVDRFRFDSTFTINHVVNMRFLDKDTTFDGHLLTNHESGGYSQKWKLTRLSVPLDDSREQAQAGRLAQEWF